MEEYIMMTKEKSSKGITLVALVITIIILLILSGIAIAVSYTHLTLPTTSRV